MNLFEAIFLGLVQGFTEFLPVSSSGHLVIIQSLLPNFSQPGILFDAVLHAGTLVAVIIYFRKTLVSLDRNLLTILALGTIPAGIAGFAFKDWFEALFSNPRTIGFELLITGFMNFFVDRMNQGTKNLKQINFLDAVVIGVFQAVAIIPAISRSGSTIFAGIFRGIKKEDAAFFSFLLSIPSIGGAVVLEIADYAPYDVNYFYYFVGFLVSFIVGYFSIGVLLKLLIQRHFSFFAYYCFALGLTFIILAP